MLPSATVKRRGIGALALAVCLFGCAPSGDRVELLTGVDSCYAGGEQGTDGQLVADPEYGTRFNGKPVMWPLGFTGVRLVGGEVAVLNHEGRHIATTGRTYHISYAPVGNPEKHQLMESIEAFPAAASCGYAWDFHEVK